MFSNAIDFLCFSRNLIFDVIMNPSTVVSRVSALPIDRCLKFGWLCFFISTIVSSGFQSIFTDQVLHQITSDPTSFDEMSRLLSSLSAEPVGDLKERLEVVRLASLLNLLLSPLSSLFFLYLLTGAMFALAKVLTIGKPSQGVYEDAIKIVALGQAPLLFCFVPMLGPIIGSLWSVWFIARGFGSLFQIHIVGRLSLVVFSFVLLYSVWNSTISLLATAYHKDLSTQDAKNVEQT